VGLFHPAPPCRKGWGHPVGPPRHSPSEPPPPLPLGRDEDWALLQLDILRFDTGQEQRTWVQRCGGDLMRLTPADMSDEATHDAITQQCLDMVPEFAKVGRAASSGVGLPETGSMTWPTVHGILASGCTQAAARPYTRTRHSSGVSAALAHACARLPAGGLRGRPAAQ
jgi:hypothetical protein